MKDNMNKIDDAVLKHIMVIEETGSDSNRYFFKDKTINDHEFFLLYQQYYIL